MELMQIMMSKIKRTEAKCAALEKEFYSKVMFFIAIFLNKIVKLFKITHQSKIGQTYRNFGREIKNLPKN